VGAPRWVSARAKANAFNLPGKQPTSAFAGLAVGQLSSYGYQMKESRKARSGVGLRERRWIILGEDGRHVTIGRHTDPSEDELAQAAAALGVTEQGGGVAVVEGRYYSRECISVMMVRELTPTRVSWETAVAAFEAARHQANMAPPV
jgi:hypothetical protein